MTAYKLLQTIIQSLSDFGGKSWPACPHAQEDIEVIFTAPGG